MWKTMLAAALASTLLMTAGATTIAQDKAAVAFGYEFEAIEGGRLSLGKWRGRVLLVVNTASFCGYTAQYAGLQTLWERYEKAWTGRDRRTSNDFGGQEPKGDAEIASFCQGAFGVTFPLTTKETVAGAQAHPFYRWAHDVLGSGSAPRWNFHKYLIGRDGKLIAGYGANIEPLSPVLIKAIETALGTS